MGTLDCLGRAVALGDKCRRHEWRKTCGRGTSHSVYERCVVRYLGLAPVIHYLSRILQVIGPTVRHISGHLCVFRNVELYLKLLIESHFLSHPLCNGGYANRLHSSLNIAHCLRAHPDAKEPTA